MNSFETTTGTQCLDELTAHYNEATRFYHNLGHVQDCLDQLKQVPDSFCEDRESIELALWFHDAIYDASRSDNESASAELAAKWLSKMDVSPVKIERIRQLIQITDHRDEPQSPDEKLIVDIDLSILGRDETTYARYAAAIRQEYGHVPEAEYRAGRAAVLRGFLEREPIYGTPFFRGKYEAAARKNLETEIAALVESSAE